MMKQILLAASATLLLLSIESCKKCKECVFQPCAYCLYTDQSTSDQVCSETNNAAYWSARSACQTASGTWTLTNANVVGVDTSVQEICSKNADDLSQMATNMEYLDFKCVDK